MATSKKAKRHTIRIRLSKTEMLRYRAARAILRDARWFGRYDLDYVSYLWAEIAYQMLHERGRLRASSYAFETQGGRGR